MPQPQHTPGAPARLRLLHHQGRIAPCWNRPGDTATCPGERGQSLPEVLGCCRCCTLPVASSWRCLLRARAMRQRCTPTPTPCRLDAPPLPPQCRCRCLHSPIAPGGVPPRPHTTSGPHVGPHAPPPAGGVCCGGLPPCPALPHAHAACCRGHLPPAPARKACTAAASRHVSLPRPASRLAA